MMNKAIRFTLFLVALMTCTKGQCTDLPQWLGNFSLGIGHCLNYHFDGNRTMYWDSHSSRYRINNGTSYEVSYRFSKGLSISCFRERFSGIYKDSISVLTEELILSRYGYNIGLMFSSKIDISNRLSLNPRIGFLRRTGYESYASVESRDNYITIVELADLGLTSGLSLNYSIGKGISAFALADYTRFVRLYSSESGERDFYDGPTQNYIRTRIGVQYSFSHLLNKEE